MTERLDNSNSLQKRLVSIARFARAFDAKQLFANHPDQKSETSVVDDDTEGPIVGFMGVGSFAKEDLSEGAANTFLLGIVGAVFATEGMCAPIIGDYDGELSDRQKRILTHHEYVETVYSYPGCSEERARELGRIITARWDGVREELAEEGHADLAGNDRFYVFEKDSM